MSAAHPQNRTIEEIDAELAAIDARTEALWAEKARVRGAERTASLPADWREQTIAAVETALGEEEYGGRANVDLTPQLTLSINVRFDPHASDGDEEDLGDGE